MKKILVSIITISFLFASCDTDLDINKDPDGLSEIAIKSQLPAGIGGIIGAEGSHYALIGGFWSQYWTQSNASNQYRDIDSYLIGSSNYFTAWRDMYDALGDIRQVKTKAEAQGNWNYYLIATVLETQASQVLTDFYGSIPYKEANNASILEPKYDTGEEVYEFMIADLNLALSKNLAESQGDSPKADDLIFQGDMTKWTQFANTMKLKIFMRQINSSRSAIAIAEIKNLLTNGVSFLNDDAAMSSFTDAPNLSNPLYESDRRQLNTATNLRMSTTLSSFFDVNSDSRKPFYYGSGVPMIQGDFIKQVPAPSSVSIVQIKAATPAYLMSKEESLFLQAEAQARYGTDAKTLYDTAVLENFNKYALNGSSYIASGGVYEFPNSGTLENKIKAIITQKWIAGFPGNGFEAFFDKNRTGYPTTSAVAQSSPSYIPGELSYSVTGVTVGKFPKRIIYPQEEKNTNKNAAPQLPITTPVWWSTN